MIIKKTAVVIGATGLVGSHLVALLLNDGRYERVKVFGRRSIEREHPKLTPYRVDFDHPDEWQRLLTGDDLFSCLGTTIKTADSREAQYKVDYTYQYETAQAAAENGITTYVLVSSSGADPASKFFYPRIKGELDREVKNLPFRAVRILKPSVLAGQRREKRLGESLAVILGNLLTPLIPPLRKHRPIPASIVAQAMINAANDPTPGFRIYERDEVFTLAAEELP